ncbi:membrane protein insertase YidC [Sphingomonas prati]|uniref:Membrane protein insertase YidC n=1 Tax=Sphingomonas prati TaxID=1843237 RepID=A0A7W9BTX5_9SPHN|nr:membrane protein insertase YidC [Sphingomonas prati]MBB5730056.1 YidC/Oxa1 family membrane protein insertase [Sphingomonas prati]GGE91124.1 membrane protein insertase YidC [Sphingomonas prati]
MNSDNRNLILAIVLSALVLFGWSAISNRFLPTAAPPSTQIVDGKQVALPKPEAAPDTPVAIRDRAVVLGEAPRVQIKTPKLNGSINLRGGRIDDLTLTAYGETIAKNAPPVRLLSPAGTADAYFAGFGWTGEGAAIPSADTVWTADRTLLAPNSPVTLSWANGQGQIYRLRFAVDPNYMFTVTQTVANAGAGPVAVQPYALVSRNGVSKDPDGWTMHTGPISTFNGSTNYGPNFSELDKAGATGVSYQSTGGWLGFGDKYWLTALAPDQRAPIDAAFRAGEGQRYQAQLTNRSRIVPVGQQTSAVQHFFAGAKEVSTLDGYESSLGIPHFGRAIDWGWFEVLEKPVFYVLHWLFEAIGNFGVAIILLTVLVKILMFPIAQKQFKSMAGMRVIQPKMKILQERYKDDKAKLQSEMLELYKTEKVSPLSGCLPILIQIPIGYALYKVLMLTIEMRHQPFALWIKDLAAPDPLTPVNLFGLLDFTPPHLIAIGIVPILLGVTQYFQFKLNPAPADPTQAQIFAIMPWVFMFIMAPYAVGLLLYWITQNLITIAQQTWFYSRYPGMKAAMATPAPTPTPATPIKQARTPKK